MSIINNISKEFFNTSESKIYVEFNNIPLEEQEEKKGILFLGSNPLWPGSENNKILNNVFYQLAEENFCVMKLIFYSYKTETFKKHDSLDMQYVRDTSAAIDFFFNKFSCVKYFTIIGYSWAASIALHISTRRPEISNIILISPTLSLKNCDFLSFLNVFKIKVLVLIGDQDQITSKNVFLQYMKLLRSKQMQVQNHILENTDHYYTNGVKEVLKHIHDFLSETSTANFLE
jgi:uncharacterized protein